MKILSFIVLIACLFNCVNSTFWCYHSLTKNLNLIDANNGKAQLLQGSNDNPCVNATITKNGVTDYVNTNLVTYKAILTSNFNKQVFPSLPVSCPASMTLKAGPNQQAFTKFCTCNTNTCNMETNPTSLSCLSERKGLYYISHHENEGGVSDSYGQVEQCEDPNDTCISGVGNTEYTTVSYKGCYGNLLKVLGDSISGNIPKSVTNCMKASVTGTFVTSYVNFCQCKGNFCNVDWTNSEPLTCVTGKTGLGLYSLLDMTPTSKVCSINEPCGKVIINDNGNIITAQGCASDVESLFTTNPAVSYPDNQCSEFGLLELASTEKNYDATLCSCTTQNCVMNN